MLEKRKLALILLVLVPGLWLRLQVFRIGYYTVTYGNTATHISWADLFLRTGQFPLWEPSYGGKPSLYVPIYRLLLTAVAWLFQGDAIFASNVITVASVVSPIGLLLVVKAITGRFYPGLIAVLVSETSSQLVIYTARPLPQFLGMTMLPIAVYLFLRGRYVATTITSLLITMTHQETALVLVLVLSMYLLLIGILNLLKKPIWSRTNPCKRISVPSADWVACLAATSLSIIFYLSWQGLITGNLNIFTLAQFKFHEHSVVQWNHLIEIGITCLVFGSTGATIFYAREGVSRNGVFMASWLLVCLLAIKNELFAPIAPSIFPIMCDRFLAYLAQVLSVFAAIGIFNIYKSLAHSARQLATSSYEIERSLL